MYPDNYPVSNIKWKSCYKNVNFIISRYNKQLSFEKETRLCVCFNKLSEISVFYFFIHILHNLDFKFKTLCKYPLCVSLWKWHKQWLYGVTSWPHRETNSSNVQSCRTKNLTSLPKLNDFTNYMFWGNIIWLWRFSLKTTKWKCILEQPTHVCPIFLISFSLAN